MTDNKLVLLSVLAHPDDESFGMGGTLAYYAEKGVEVHLICATRGEAGDVDPSFLQEYGTISELREAELRCAADHLGIAEIHFLNYRDSGMPGSQDNDHPDAFCQAPVKEVAAKVVEIIREIKPQVVLTFDPIGGFHHPDHIAIHKAALEAFTLAGDHGFECRFPPHQPEKLYFHTIPKRFIQIALKLVRFLGKDPRKLGKNKDIDLTLIADGEYPVHAEIDYRAVAKRKQGASNCHASQGGSKLVNGPAGWISRIFVHKDQFTQAYPEPVPGLNQSDLFNNT